MTNKELRWEVLGKIQTSKTPKLLIEKIVGVLLENRGIKTEGQREEFFKPTPPEYLVVKELEIKENFLNKAIKRIEWAIKQGEEIIIYGDYDADGICATAILWETLYRLTKNVKPYIPSRFEEGYGLNAVSIQKLKMKNEKLKIIITVDNGIVANDAVDAANKLGVDVIITDHHQRGEMLPKAYSIIHTDKISGSGVSWILSREIVRKFKIKKEELIINNSLELTAIGIIADQLPLIGPNRSFAKYGLEQLNKTERPGLLALFEEAGLNKVPNLVKIGTYEVNFVIAPRINAMGRLEHAIDSLRLLCTKNELKARELANFMGKTNRERQRVVDEVILHARGLAAKTDWRGAIVLAHESYHEGVIGLAAAKLVEEFYLPAIVISMGEKISKASARSIIGFNIIESIRKLDDIILGGGGHPMAAGFSIETSKIDIFRQKFNDIVSNLLTEEILTKKLKIDLVIDFENLTMELVDKLKKFEPTGIGNPTPVFATEGVEVVEARTVGSEDKHLKMVLRKKGIVFDAIAFNKGDIYPKISSSKKIDVAYNFTEDNWNGDRKLQLRVKDLRIR